MSIETKFPEEDIWNKDTLNQLSWLRREIVKSENKNPLQKERLNVQTFLKFNEIWDILEWEVTVENLENYLMAFETLVKDFVQNKNTTINNIWINELYQTGFSKIITLINILDWLIIINLLRNKSASEDELYKKWKIQELIWVMWERPTKLDYSFFEAIENNIGYTLNENLDDNQIASNEDNYVIDKKDDSQVNDYLKSKRNSIQIWVEDLIWANISIN